MCYTVLRICAIALVVGLKLVASAHAAPPNVVLIFIDDLGYGDIGPFGNTTIRTPNLDRFAAEGMKFSCFYATPVCSMSRAALLTGCYNARVSIPGVLFPPSRIGLNPAETTLAEVFKSAGYATICIGKWHLGHLDPFLPTRQGFDSYFGIPYSNDMSIDPENARFASECLFREGMTAERAGREAARHLVPLMRNEEIVEYPADQLTLTERYTAEAVKFLREHRAQPFFLYLPHSMVHVPLAASDKFRGRSRAGLFGDTVEEIDWSVGEIVKTLKELDLERQTLVIFTSDNGAATGSAGPFRGKKGTNYEGGVREPCIMRWTGKIPAGTECRQMTGNIDLLPTLAALVDRPLAADHTLHGRAIDGRDISSLMFDAQAGPVRDVHLYFHGERLQAIRRGPWKLHLTTGAPGGPANGPKGKSPPKKGSGANGTAKLELYHLLDDPAETNNLADEKPELVAELRAEADRRAAEIKVHARPAGTIASREK